MNARHQECRPHSADAQEAVKHDVLHAHLVGGEHHSKERQADGDVDKRYFRGIEQRDDNHRPEVVDDGERCQKHLGSKRNAVAKGVDYGERERNVGCHRYSPATGRRRSGVQHGVNQRRNKHPGHGGTYRKDCVTRVGQLTADELALQFKPHNEEEHRHKSVVNPVVKRVVKIRLAIENETELMFKQMEIPLAPRRIGQQQGHNHTYAEHYPGRLFPLDKLLQGHYQPPAYLFLILH